MANPLAIFRKYQKTMLAVAAVGAMLAFGILPILSEWMSSSAGGGGQVREGSTIAVSWKGGALREDELQRLRGLRENLRRFQQGVIQRTMERGSQPRSVVIPNTNSEASIVESILLAQEAERMGVRIGDDAILTHLREHLSDNTIERDELALILKQTTGDQLGQQQLFEGLRTELAAHQLRVLANGAAFDGRIDDTAVTPGQGFEYFKRLNRRMTAEVMPLAVAEYVDQVKESPTEGEIAELYEEYKDTLPSPYLPTPGFKEPTRASFQWLKADFQTFLDREIENLTEEEIQQYYEENKSSYKKLSLPSTEDLLQPGEQAGTGESNVETGGDEGANLDAADQKTKSDEATEAQIETEAPESTEAESEPDAGDTESDADDYEDQGDDSASGASGQDALPEIGEAADADADSESTATEPSGDEPESQDQSGTEDATTDDTADDTDTADQTDTADETDVSDFSPQEEVDDSSASALDELPASSSEEAEYETLEEVRDDIARTLARPKASEAIRKAIDAANGELRAYFDDYMYWDTSPEEEKGAQPAPPDFKEIGERLGLVPGEMRLISVYDAEEYELGRAFELDFSTGQIRRIPFTAIGFSPRLTVYSPQRISAADVDSQFVFWKTEQREAYTPELEEARPSIVRHWKMKKALELAKAEGERLAKRAREEDQSLRQAYGDTEGQTITDTGQFTWMTFGATPTGQGPPRLSSVEGVEFPGNDFMRDVASLNSGGVTVTNNHPETMVYVVYMKSSTAEQDLQTLYLNEGVKQPILHMARQDYMQTAADWYTSLEDEWALKWERPPYADSQF